MKKSVSRKKKTTSISFQFEKILVPIKYLTQKIKRNFRRDLIQSESLHYQHPYLRRFLHE